MTLTQRTRNTLCRQVSQSVDSFFRRSCRAASRESGGNKARADGSLESDQGKKFPRLVTPSSFGMLHLTVDRDESHTTNWSAWE